MDLAVGEYIHPSSTPVASSSSSSLSISVSLSSSSVSSHRGRSGISSHLPQPPIVVREAAAHADTTMAERLKGSLVLQVESLIHLREVCMPVHMHTCSCTHTSTCTCTTQLHVRVRNILINIYTTLSHITLYLRMCACVCVHACVRDADTIMAGGLNGALVLQVESFFIIFVRAVF